MSVDVVILAGGRGTRLRPYTTILPKPLLPIGDRPVLEILLRQLARGGFGRVTLAVGHLAELLEAYFGDGSRFDIEIEYAREDGPLGTAGPLAHIPLEGEHLLVLNGDLLTTLDFRALVDHHVASPSVATVAITERNVPIQFGVVRVDEGSRTIAGYDEKPTLSYDVSMGVYAFDRRVLELIPAEGPLDFPTLVGLMLEQGWAVDAYRSQDYWLDIGNPEDYDRALEDGPDLLDRLLPGA